MNDKVVVLPVSDASELAQRLLDLQPKNAVLVMMDEDVITIRTTQLDDTVRMFGALEFAKMHIWSGL